MTRRDRRSRPATNRTASSAGPGSPASDTTSGVTPAWARWRWLVPWLLVFALLAVLYPGPMFEGHVYGSVDAAASAAFREVGDAARAAGDYPFWNPYLFLGMPTFGSLAYNLGVYPPTVVFEFLQNRLGLPPLTWMLGHLLLGGVGMWWLLGRFDVPWSGRLLGCVTWLWFARVVAWGVHGHGSKLGAAMAMPWLLGLAWEVLARGRWRAVGLLALVLGLQFLRGHVQISYYTLLLLGFLTVWNLIWPLDGSQRPTLAERGRRAGLMAATVALGFSIGAALLLPVHDYAEISTRGQEGASGGGRTPYEYATDWSLGPEDLAATVFAGAAGFGKATYAGRMPFTDYPNYVGLLVLGLAVMAWWSSRRRLVLALAVAALAGLLLAMGRYSPGIYQLAYEILPYFKKFRVPSMAMVVPALLLAVLAAIGARTLAGLGAEASPRLRRTGLVVLIVGAVLLLAGGTGAVASAYSDQLAALAERAGKPTAPVLLDAAWDLHRSLLIRQGLVVMVAGAAVLLAARRSGFARVGLVPVLAILVAVDLGSVAHLVTQPQDGLVEVVRGADGGGRLAPATRLERPWRPAADSHLPPAQAERLRELVGHDRVLPLGSDATSNAFMIAEIRSLGGYHPAKPAVAEAVRQRLFQGVPSGAVARWLAASVLLTPGPLAPESLDRLATFGLEIEGGGEAIGRRMAYPIADSLPRARLVDRWMPQPTSTAGGDALERFLDDVATGRHDPAATVVLADTPDPLPQTGPEPLPEPVFVHDGLDAIEIEAETPRPALLLLADSVAPGWRVRVNGETRPLLVADHVLRAVALPAGRHVVRFEYRDPALARGLILASCGLVVSLALAAWPRRRRQATGPDGTGGETTS